MIFAPGQDFEMERPLLIAFAISYGNLRAMTLVFKVGGLEVAFSGRGRQPFSVHTRVVDLSQRASATMVAMFLGCKLQLRSRVPAHVRILSMARRGE